MGESRVDVSSLDNIYSTTEPIVIKPRENGKHIYRESTEELTLKPQKLRVMEEKTTSSIRYQKKIKQETTEEKIQQKKCVGHWSIASIVCTL
jgi:hypothetical protein